MNVGELLLESLIVPERHKDIIITYGRADEHREIQYVMQKAEAREIESSK